MSAYLKARRRLTIRLTDVLVASLDRIAESQNIPLNELLQRELEKVVLSFDKKPF